MEDKGYDYRKKITGLISLRASHYSSADISLILQLDYSQLESLMRQNPRLPKPYDWDNVTDEDIKTKFYHKGKVNKYTDIVEGNYVSDEDMNLSETDINSDNDFGTIFGDEKDNYLKQILEGYKNK